jgi:hypothetical protein
MMRQVLVVLQVRQLPVVASYKKLRSQQVWSTPVNGFEHRKKFTLCTPVLRFCFAKRATAMQDRFDTAIQTLLI